MHPGSDGAAEQDGGLFLGLLGACCGPCADGTDATDATDATDGQGCEGSGHRGLGLGLSRRVGRSREV
ncbi:hypothetical protein [Kitasatospora albolonga]|uniref:hypothetical protein n=1 Tax=Kitasatospora albolonga TaxID=68173 RepID=UPI0031E89E4E